jgi:rare lipoprotein A
METLHKLSLIRSVRVFIMLLLALTSCVSAPPSLPELTPVQLTAPPPAVVDVPAILDTQTGLASYYHPSLDGNETASGLIFDNEALTAAHPTYPLGTLVRVTNLEKERSAVELRITDRGPTAENTAEGVIIDLSGAAAKQMDMLVEGRIQVRVDVLDWGTDERL